MEEICVRIHGEEEEAERFCEENGEGDERKVRENEMKREKDMCQMRGSQVKMEVVVQLMSWIRS